MSFIKQLSAVCRSVPVRFMAVFTVLGSFLFEAAPSMATESAAETAIKTLAEKIGSEGIAIFLICITAVTGLIAVLVAVNLGVKKIKSFAK